MTRLALRRVALVGLSFALAPAPLPSQQLAVAATPRAPASGSQSGNGTAHAAVTVVRVSKWALLGATVGFGVYALRHTARAQRYYDSLIDACRTSPGRCDLADGRYTDERIEQLYLQTLEQDRHARVGIVGGQACLLGSLALFIYDLRNGRGPADIPYPGGGTASLGPAPRVAAGLRLTF